MNSINSLYSVVFQCDNRTALSVGLSLLAAVTTAIVLGVLAYCEYITPTIAYSAAPTIGTLLILIGVAIAVVRKDISSKAEVIPSLLPAQAEKAMSLGATAAVDSQPKSVQDPSQIKQSFNDAKSVQLVHYSKHRHQRRYLKWQKPTQDSPYYYLKARIALEGATEHVEVEVLDVHYDGGESCYKLLFQYLDTQYHKEITNSLGIEQTWFQRKNENLLLRADYQRLTDPRGPAALLMFTEDSHNADGTAYFSQKEFPQATYEGKVVTFTRTDTTPIRSLKGLKEFPTICALLQATSWSWEAPHNVSLIVNDPTDRYHECRWVSQYRVEWRAHST